MPFLTQLNYYTNPQVVPTFDPQFWPDCVPGSVVVITKLDERTGAVHAD